MSLIVAVQSGTDANDMPAVLLTVTDVSNSLSVQLVLTANGARELAGNLTHHSIIAEEWIKENGSD